MRVIRWCWVSTAGEANTATGRIRKGNLRRKSCGYCRYLLTVRRRSIQTPLTFAMLLSFLFLPSPVSFTPTLFIFCLFFCKVKRESFFCTCLEGSGGIAPLILYLVTVGDWSVSRAFRFFFREDAAGCSWVEAWWTPESAWVIWCDLGSSLCAWWSGVRITIGENSFLMSTTSRSARGVKWNRRERVCLPESSADVRKDLSCTIAPPICFRSAHNENPISLL